jgi:glutamate--cysteine ligase
MSESFKDTLNRFSDLNLLNYTKHSERGIEKESLRVLDSTISSSDHPKKLGAALTNPFITTDFSESLLEVITQKKGKIEESLKDLEEVLAFSHRNIPDVIWPGSIPCSIENESEIRIAKYGSSNSAKLKELYRKGLSLRYGSMMQCVSGIHYNFSLSNEFFAVWENKGNHSKAFQDEKYLSLVRNFRRNAWLLLYLFGASPIVPNNFIGNRKNFLKPFNKEDSYLEYATSLRMSELGYMSEAQDDLHITYNTLDEYIDNLKLALTKKFLPYEKIGIKKGDDYLQINDCIIQIENEYYSSIRPKRVVSSGERPINVLRDKGIEYVEVRCMDNNPFFHSSIDEDTAYFLETFLMVSLIEENKPCDKDEIVEILDNWQSVVKGGRNPNQQLKVENTDISLTEAAENIIEKMKSYADALLPEAAELKTKILKSIKIQEAKLKDSSKTPSGRIIKEMSENNWNWEEFNNYYFEKNKKFFNESNFNLNKYEKAVEKSLSDLSNLELKKEVSFDSFLDNYLKSI